MSPVLSWFQMGPYSFYVWPAYGIVSVILVMHVLGMKWTKRHTFKKLQEWFRRQSSCRL